jgi:hypothetical protein
MYLLFAAKYSIVPYRENKNKNTIRIYMERKKFNAV